MNTAKLDELLAAIILALFAMFGADGAFAENQVPVVAVTAERTMAAVEVSATDTDGFRLAFHADARKAAEAALEDIAVEFDATMPLGIALNLAALEIREQG